MNVPQLSMAGSSKRHNSKIWLTCLALIALSLCSTVRLFAQSENQQGFDAAVRYFQTGRFSEAIQAWEQFIDSQDESKNKVASIQAYLGVAEANLKIGLYWQSWTALSTVQQLLDQTPINQETRKSLYLLYSAQLGNYYLATDQKEPALQTFAEAASLAGELHNDSLLANVINDHGNALFVNNYFTDALSAYRRSFDLFRGLESPLALKPLLNIIRLNLNQRQWSETLNSLELANRFSATLPPDYQTANGLLALSQIVIQLLDIQDESIQQKRLELLKFQNDWLDAAIAVAEDLKDSRMLAYGNGFLGGNLLNKANNEADLEEALTLTKKALLYAQQSQAGDITYQFQKQAGEILRRLNQYSEAADYYRMAIATLQPMRQELSRGYREPDWYFNGAVRPVYIDFVDLLLQQSHRVSDGQSQLTLLTEARDVLEELKSAELQDYFGDECVVAQEQQAVEIDSIAYGAAILYPIILSDRLELILSLDGRLRNYTSAIDQQTLTDNAEKFRIYIQDSTSARYLPYARRLYRWLIEPIRQDLAATGVDTLIVVPDALLGSIPMAALHSGKEYLIEQFALGITPSLTLTAPRTLNVDTSKALLAGISDSVQGYAPLPNVPSELAGINEQLGGAVLSNQAYTKDALKKQLAQTEFSIVHVATHGVVGSSPEESLLLTYDSSMNMNEIEQVLRAGRFRENPVELLTLSACETAIGNEQAALGMAGIALKSGAKSSLASLWLVQDRATALLMAQFYRQLGRNNQSKAQSLRRAQLQMIEYDGFKHPANWSAFLLIGNWL